MNEERFLCASSPLSLTGLLRRGRFALFGGLGLAVLVHLSLSRICGLRTEAGTAKPFTTRFVKRQPRLTKPLEMKKRPRPKRRQIQRKMVAVKAREAGERLSSGIRPGQVVRRLSRPGVQVGRVLPAATVDMEPMVVAQRIVGSREAEHVVDTSLEMVDIDALDTGQYQAMVIQDPSDKRNVRGYLRLVAAFPYSAYWPVPAHNDKAGQMRALHRLIGKLNEWTGIKASITRQVTYDSAELFETPWVYLRIGYRMDPTRGEVEGLGRYVLNGGFFYYEGPNMQPHQGEQHLKAFVKSALESQGYRQGRDWEYQLLPASHPIFSCFYNFPDGPPVGWNLVCKYLYGELSREDVGLRRARGIEIDGRLVVFNTNQDYCAAWGLWGWIRGYERFDPTAQFQFGINTIVFALTQEGSITRQVMDSVR